VCQESHENVKLDVSVEIIYRSSKMSGKIRKLF
jgi:hypothetical protein